MSFVLALCDSATLPNIANAREQIFTALADHEAVALDLGALAQADLSFVQLLTAARTHARERNKVLVLKEPANPVLTALLDRAGFTSAPSSDDIGFWFHGDIRQ